MKFIAGAVVMLLVIAAVAGFILGTGRFNVAATAPPTSRTSWRPGCSRSRSSAG